ncbi:MAG: amino acid permease-associated region [Bryobacterales bacterium]|nr:amino acid permease-associated region [Bryobacterales bacterium]
MSALDFILGRPLASSEERAEQIGPVKGIPVFGLDALGSAAYGPEAALTLLVPLGLAGLNFIVPLSISIIILLVIVYLSYRQTIAAYPSGGGSYIVARQNLGTFAGLLAASALLIDYSLDAAVGISTGIGALTSAVPSLHPHTLLLCLVSLLLLTLVNLRGVSETGGIFLVPTYLFLGCMAIALALGVAKTISSGGHPVPVVKPPTVQATAAFSIWLLIKAYASGCTALTGVEAVSNGVGAFREDRIKNAQRTLGLIILALGIMLAGIAVLVRAYGIVATDPNGNGYQSVLSMLFGAVAGRGWFYYVAIFSVLVLLTLSANTAFADFPRVCHFVAEDGFLPAAFANRGRRLVYSEGIIVLMVFTAALLIGFGGITDRLIPLFAVGAFLAFTMSQAGMVAHWRREGGKRARQNMILNLTGALVTGLTVLVVIVAKFSEGAWITLIAIPALLFTMYAVRRHYEKIRCEIDISTPLEPYLPNPPILVVTMQSWTRVNKQALRAAMALSREIKVVHVSEDDRPNDFCDKWKEYIEAPARQAGLPVPELVHLHSPYRLVVTPILDYVKRLAAEHPNRRIITVIPELIERRWFQWLLHTQRAEILKGRLLMEGNDRISVLNVPWYQKSA